MGHYAMKPYIICD